MTQRRASRNRTTRGPELNALPEHLLARPDAGLGPPVTTKKATLPCRALTWSDFERLCVAVAKSVDHARDLRVDARLYGVSGQAQHGIDLYARLPTGDRVVYQARDIARLTERRLTKAVNDFVEGHLPFGAQRFVLCVACEARDTGVLDALEAARAQHPNLEIDLYDQETLSDLLRPHSEIVERFFGASWRAEFCTQPGRSLVDDPEQPADATTADELLRGPVRSLGLGGLLSQADGAPPVEAAQTFETVARRLEARGYSGHGTLMRRRRAQALQSAGRWTEAFACWFDLARQ